VNVPIPRRRWFGVLCIPALILAGVQATGTSATGVISTSTLAYGTVTNAAGAPVAGARVTLEADPTTMPTTSSELNVPVLATDTTDSLGHYTLSLPSSFTAAGDVNPGTGLVSYNVLVDGPGVHTLSTFDNVPPGAASLSKTSSLRRSNLSPTAVTTDVIDPNSEAATDWTDTSTPDPIISYPEVDFGATYDPFAASSTSAFTNIQLIKNYGKHWDAVGAWFSDTGGVSADFYYGNGASSSLGVGVSATGKFGSFHASGTHSESTSATQGYPARTGPRQLLYLTEFIYKLYRYQDCAPKSGCAPVYYKTVATGWAGGGQLQHTSTPSGINNCVPEPNGGYWDRTSSKAITWTNGASLSGAIGIDLSIQTGFTTDAHNHITFTEGGHRLCGRGNPPGLTPYVLRAAP
jgi:hypothetical protein